MSPIGPWLHRVPLTNVTSSDTARLMRRAQRIAQLRHPNLVRMLPMPGGAGLAPTLMQGRCLADFTLAGTFKRFELEQVVSLLLDILNGLSALHEDLEDGVGFVHGEVSPRCIYVSEDGTARLVPLLSRHWMAEAPVVPNGYAAPEFLLSARVDSRADLFSVGVMLGEELTGRPLFPDPALDAVIARLLGGKLLPLEPAPENRWAAALGPIVERAISPYPELRFRTAIELSNAIGAAVAPHLAARAHDAWQPEAPTLPQAPRPRIAPSRSLTPLATVLDLTPSPESLHQAAARPSDEAPQRQKRASASPRRWLVALSVAAVVALALSSRPVQKYELRPVAAAPRPLEGANEPPDKTSASNQMVSPPLASSGVHAAAQPTAPSAAPSSAPPGKRLAVPRKRDSRAVPRKDDYGI